jgi:DNA polymerase-1
MRILLIDGNNFFARAWFAITGKDKAMPANNAIKYTIGRFKTMVVGARRDHRPDHVVICWDNGKDAERISMFQGYKNREEKPNEYYIGIRSAQQAIDDAQIYSQVTRPNTECDDILATLARYYACMDYMTIIATDDKDMLQLLSKNVIITHSKRGNIDDGRFKQEHGFAPILFIDYLAIVGDTSDSIPGVHGIGEKGATELVARFGTIENIYANISSVPKKYVKKLQDGFDNAMLSKKLITLKMIMDIDPMAALAIPHKDNQMPEEEMTFV